MMPGKNPVNHDLETAIHRVGQLEHDYEAAMHRIAELEVLLEKADEVPTIVVECDNGVLNKVSSTRPIRLISLDEDVEGADEDRIILLGDIEYYPIVESTGLDEGVDPEFCAQVLLAVEKGD